MDINSLFPSNYLKAADLKGQPRTVTIESCAPEQIGDNNEMKPILRFVGIKKGLVLNRTNSAVLAAAFGPETDDWTGKQLTLLVLPVPFQGKLTDAIRVQVAHSRPSQPESAPTEPAHDFNDDLNWD